MSSFTAWSRCHTLSDRVAFLYQGHIIYRGAAQTIADAPDPLVRQFVRGELEGPLAS